MFHCSLFNSLGQISLMTSRLMTGLLLHAKKKKMYPSLGLVYEMGHQCMLLRLVLLELEFAHCT